MTVFILESNDQTVTSSDFITDLLEALENEFKSLISGNLLSHTIESTFCKNSDGNIDCHELFKALKSGLKQINEFVSHASIKIRKKRAADCIKRKKPRAATKKRKKPHVATKKRGGGHQKPKQPQKSWQKITSKDIRKSVSKKLKTKKGQHVDHIVEMQTVARAIDLSGIKKGSPEFNLIRKTFNEKPNLQVLGAKENIRKGAAWKNGKATKGQAIDATKAFDKVWKSRSEVQRMFDISPKFQKFTLYLAGEFGVPFLKKHNLPIVYPVG